jgi:hypothetical protein
MVIRKVVRDHRRPSASEKAISAIRNNAVILDMAVKYVCEDAFLKKLGEDTERHLYAL